MFREASGVQTVAETTDILTRLLERTNQDKVGWQSTSDEDTFTAVLGNASVLILVDRTNAAILQILNQEGREIERLDSGTQEGQQWGYQLRELYSRARRIALGVDSQLDDLLQELEADI